MDETEFQAIFHLTVEWYFYCVKVILPLCGSDILFASQTGRSPIALAKQISLAQPISLAAGEYN